jgi:AraC family ethanolamine operon transcriptional activator
MRGIVPPTRREQPGNLRQAAVSHGARATLAQLCRVARVCARTLEYGFGEVYGVSPITYIRCAKLSRVHHVLQNADRRATSIARSAADWGFVHMGQFAKDYRALFGECPSDTLRGSGGGRPD